MVVRQGPRRAAGALLFAFIVAILVSVSTASAAPRVLAAPAGAILVNFDIPVDAGSADYFHRAAQMAIAGNDDLVIVMNTPGGLLVNMVQIINSTQEVQNHGLAVYTYVPPAAFAASAGSYIALATNAWRWILSKGEPTSTFRSLAVDGEAAVASIMSSPHSITRP